MVVPALDVASHRDRGVEERAEPLAQRQAKAGAAIFARARIVEVD